MANPSNLSPVAGKTIPEGDNKLDLASASAVPKNNGKNKDVATPTSMSPAAHSAHGGLGDSHEPNTVDPLPRSSVHNHSAPPTPPTKLAYRDTHTPSPPHSLAPLSPLVLPSTPASPASDSDLEWTTPSGSPLSATAPAPPHLVTLAPPPVTISLDELRSLPRESLVHWPAVTTAHGHTVIHRAIPVPTPKTASESGSRGRCDGWDNGSKEAGEREGGSRSESGGGGGGVGVAATGEAAVPGDAHEGARASATTPLSVCIDETTTTTTGSGTSTPQPKIFGPDLAALLAARLVCQSPLTALASGAASRMPTPGLTTATAAPLFPVPDHRDLCASTPTPSSPTRTPGSQSRTPHSPRSHTPRSPFSRRPSASLPEAWWAPAPSVRAAIWAVLVGGEDEDEHDDDLANAEMRGVVTWGEGGGFNTRCLGAFVFAPPFTPEEVAGLVASSAGLKAAPTSRRPSITTLGNRRGQESCHRDGPDGGDYGHASHAHGHSRSLSSLTAFSPVHAAFIPVGLGPPMGAGISSSNGSGSGAATMVNASIDATSTALTADLNAVPPTTPPAPLLLNLATLHKPLPETPVGTAPSSPTTTAFGATAPPPQLTRSHTARALTTRLNRNNRVPEAIATGAAPVALSTKQQALPSSPSPPTPPPPVQRPRRVTLSALGSGLGLFGFSKNNK